MDNKFDQERLIMWMNQPNEEYEKIAIEKIKEGKTKPFYSCKEAYFSGFHSGMVAMEKYLEKNAKEIAKGEI